MWLSLHFQEKRLDSDLVPNPANDTIYTYSYNSLDQLEVETVQKPGEATAAKSYAYDIYGNQTAEFGDWPNVADPETDYVYRYTWDAENRLVKGEVRAAGKTHTFKYDANGTRVGKVTQTAGIESARTNYLADYVNPSGYSQTLQETDKLNEGRAYIWSGEGLLAQTGISSSGSNSGGSGPGEPVVREETRFAHTDHLGTIKMLSNANGGLIPESNYTYSPFGDLTSGNVAATSYRFTGQYADADLGLQYHRARWLSTARGNWVSQDSVWDFPNNFGNDYAYSGMSPSNLRDVNGRMSMGEVTNVSGIIGNLSTRLLSAGRFLIGKPNLQGFIMSAVIQRVTAIYFIVNASAIAKELNRFSRLTRDRLPFESLEAGTFADSISQSIVTRSFTAIHIPMLQLTKLSKLPGIAAAVGVLHDFFRLGYVVHNSTDIMLDGIEEYGEFAKKAGYHSKLQFERVSFDRQNFFLLFKDLATLNTVPADFLKYGNDFIESSESKNIEGMRQAESNIINTANRYNFVRYAGR